MIFDALNTFFAEHFISIISTISIVGIGSDLITKYYSVVDLIFENISLLGLFIRPSTVVTLSLVCIAIYNFEWIYRIAIWIKNRIKFN